jgi:hypothetical protein
MTSKLALGVLAILVAGCGEVSGDPSSPAPAKGGWSPPQSYTGVRVVTGDGKTYFGDSAGIDVRSDGDGITSMEINLTAASGSDIWTALIGGHASSLPNGSGTAEIKQAPMGPGIAYVEHQKHGSAVAQGNAGEVTYTLAAGQVTAEFKSSMPELSATVTGTYGIRCWVTSDMAGVPTNGTAVGPDGQVLKQLVLDAKMQSEFCSKLKY